MAGYWTPMLAGYSKPIDRIDARGEIGSGPPPAAERIVRRLLLTVGRMPVLARGIGLPDLDE
jgi:hypothetical protein